jgi:hypothetical protein
MKRIDFIKTLGILAGSGMIVSDLKSEKLVLPAKNSNADMNIGVERMRITSSGNVSIGTNTPSARLVIS